MQAHNAEESERHEARAAPRPSIGGTSGEGESLFIVLTLFHRRRRPQ